MAKATKEDIEKLVTKIYGLHEHITEFRNHMQGDNLEMLQLMREVQNNIVNTFQAYERMSDKLIQMAMVNNGTPNAAASHRAQSAREVESGQNSIPLGSNSQSDSRSGNFWDQDEEEDWAEGNDTMTPP